MLVVWSAVGGPSSAFSSVASPLHCDCDYLRYRRPVSDRWMLPRLDLLCSFSVEPSCFGRSLLTTRRKVS